MVWACAVSIQIDRFTFIYVHVYSYFMNTFLTQVVLDNQGPGCIKLTINGKMDFNATCNYHRILDADWLWCLVAMVVTIESKVIINGKFYATGALSLLHKTFTT